MEHWMRGNPDEEREGVGSVIPAAELVTAARTGDHRAFASLIRSCDDTMRRLAYRLLGSRAAMDDALQDAYLKAYRRIGAYNGDAAFSTWLYTIVYRCCLDQIRTRGRRNEVNVDLSEIAVAGGIDPATQTADAVVLKAALAALPPEQAAVVLLVDGDALSYAEAATILDVCEGTIASRLNRAHTTLRTTLDDQECES